MKRTKTIIFLWGVVVGVSLASLDDTSAPIYPLSIMILTVIGFILNLMYGDE